MKLSNILILIAIICLFTYVGFSIFAGKAAIKEQINLENTEIEKSKITEDLESFSAIKLNGSIMIDAKFSNSNQIEIYDRHENCFFSVENDTLIIEGENATAKLNFKNIKTVIANDQAELAISNITANQLNITLNNSSQLIGNGFEIDSLQIYTNDASIIRIYNSNATEVFLQAEEFSNNELLFDILKITGTTAPDTRLVLSTVKNTSIQANGSFSITGQR